MIEKQKWTREGGRETAFFPYLDPIKLNIRQDLFRLVRIVILSVWVIFFLYYQRCNSWFCVEILFDIINIDLRRI